jgi:hypothetical protein
MPGLTAVCKVLIQLIREGADAKGVTVAQIAIAWALSRGRDIVPVVGARRRDKLAESLGALAVRLAILPTWNGPCPREQPPARVTPRSRWRIWIVSAGESQACI